MTRIKDALDAVAAAIIAQKDYLTDLDRQIADGDHGINMTRGFQAAMDAVEEMDDTTKPGPVLETIGKAFIHNVGGAAGPLYGTGFIKATAVCDENTKLNVASFEKLLGAAIAGIEKRGHAKKGDKTMLDALIPAARALEEALSTGRGDALSAMVTAAQQGAENTASMVSRRGRASYLGDRAKGTMDAGAVAVSLWLAAVRDSLGRG